MSSPPEKIYLQWYDGLPTWEYEITWCVDAVAEEPSYDVEYTRSDKVKELQEEIKRLTQCVYDWQTEAHQNP